jgi:hypothetical protein
MPVKHMLPVNLLTTATYPLASLIATVAVS